MPVIHHARYRGGNAHVRYSPVAVREFTEANRSRFYNGRLDESLAALARVNAPKRREVVLECPKTGATATVKVDLDADNALLAKLLGLSTATLAKLLRRFGVEGRSKLRTKDARARALLGTVERMTPAESEALFA